MGDAAALRGADPAVGAQCAQASLAAQLTTTLTYCQRCVTGTLTDHAAFMCIGKMRYLRGEYAESCLSYIRAAGVGLIVHLTPDELHCLRKLISSSTKRAREYAIAKVIEHETTLIYHLGHAWHAMQSGDAEYRQHLTRYAKGLRRLKPEADDPSPTLLLHFHDAGVDALKHQADLLLIVAEKYGRLVQSAQLPANLTAPNALM